MGGVRGGWPDVLLAVVVAGVAVGAPLAAGAVGTAVKAGTVTQEALLPVGWLVAAILLGELARHRAALVRVAEQRALEAERTREEVASRRAAEERLRIARELHDSLTHSISVIKVQAGVAVHLARKRGEEVPEVLLAIQEASGDAARDLRETLGALHVGGLARLPALLDRALAGVRVVILTNHGLDEYVFAALRAGASGFLVKDIEPEDLLRGVRVAARGEALLSPVATRALIDEFVARPPETYPKADPGVLTNREREVVVLVAAGLSNDEIAAHMVISPTTAKTHVSRAMTKLAARDRAQLVVYAYESGLRTSRQ